MLEANAALKSENFAHAEKVLRELRAQAPETQEAEDALTILMSMQRANQVTIPVALPDLIGDAKKFEAANPKDKAGILARYKAAMELKGATAESIAEAKTKVDQLEAEGVTIKSSSVAATGSAKDAFDKINAAAAAGDFDAARKLTNDFRDQTQSLEEGAEARKLLAKIEEQAKKMVADYKEKTAKLDPLAAAIEWGKYSSTVKDSVNAPEVKPLLEDLEDKTQTTAMEELGKITDKARGNLYDDAISDAQAMQKKWAGMKWSIMAKSKENSFKKQKDLYEAFLKGVKDKIASGPVDLPFPLTTKIKTQTKWKLSGLKGDALSLDAVPITAAPGLNVRLGELQPKDQHSLVLFVLPKELTADQHTALKNFCIERGLSDEADMHAKEAEKLAGK